MKLAYTIVSIDESRAGTKRAIRDRMAFLPEITAIEFVDGRVAAKLDPLLRDFEEVAGRLRDGELGVWFSQINCWRHLAGSDLDALVVLEDDAVVDREIELALTRFLANVPAGWDFVALNVPADQKQDYFYDRRFSSDGAWHFVSQKRYTLESSPHNLGGPIMATAYQGYSCVAIVYSRAGARKLLQLVGKAIRDPVDCFIFKEHHKGNLRGYAPKPHIRDFVTHREHGTIARATRLHGEIPSG